MSELHPSQAQLLEVLKANIDDPLTIRELQEILNVSSPSTIQHHIDQLEKKGYLKRNPYNSRDYQILRTPDQEIAYLNVYGMARCGPKGSILDGNPIDRIPIASRLLSFESRDAFLVRAKGGSMEPRIRDGDLVIIQKKRVVDEGSLVLCVNDGETLIKRYNRHKQNVILSSENPEYPPFISSKDFRIEGEIKGVVSKF